MFSLVKLTSHGVVVNFSAGGRGVAAVRVASENRRRQRQGGDRESSRQDRRQDSRERVDRGKNCCSDSSSGGVRCLDDRHEEQPPQDSERDTHLERWRLKVGCDGESDGMETNVDEARVFFERAVVMVMKESEKVRMCELGRRSSPAWSPP